MSILIGLVSGLFAATLTWSLTGTLVVNLPPSTGRLISVAVAAIACCVAFLAGCAACRRAARSREHLALFSSVAFAVAGGITGAVIAVCLTAAYLHSYGSTTGSAMDLVLTVLSYPIFGLLGLALGALAGFLVGLVVSAPLRVLTPAPR